MSYEELRKKYGLTTQKVNTAPERSQIAAGYEQLRAKYNLPQIESAQKVAETTMRKKQDLKEKQMDKPYTPPRRSVEDVKAEISAVSTGIKEAKAQASAADLDVRENEWLANITNLTRDTTDRTQATQDAKRRLETANRKITNYEKRGQELQSELYGAYMDLKNEPGFAEGSKYESTKTSDAVYNNLTGQYTDTGFKDIVYDYINGNEEARGIVGLDETKTGAKALGFNKTKYQHMTEDEVKVYNYLYRLDKAAGTSNAQEFLDTIDEDISRKYAAAEAQRMDSYSPAGRAVAKTITAFQSGLDSSMQGLAQSMTDEVLPKSQIAYTGEAVRETVSGAGRFVYDTVELVSHMLPSLITGYAVGGAGGALATTTKGIKNAKRIGQLASSLVTAVSAAGNSYAQHVTNGVDKKQAKIIAALTGASEAGLQYLLSGISAMGGTLTNAQLSNAISGIGNGLARVGLKFAASGLSEATEEVLQLFVEPAIVAAVTGGNYDAPKVEEILYTALLSALSAGLFEGGEIIGGEAELRRAGRMVLATDSVRAVIDEASKSSDKSMQRLAAKLEAKHAEGKHISAYDLGRAIAESASADIINSPGATVGSAEEEARKILTEAAPAAEPVAPQTEPETMQETIAVNQMPPAEVSAPQAAAQSTAESHRNVLPKADEKADIRLPYVAPETDRYQGVPERSPEGYRYTELERSGLAAGALKDVIDTAKRISNITRRRILFYDGDTASGEWARANGAYVADQDTIYVNSRSANPVAQIIAHEMTHSIEGTESYSSFGKAILDYMTKQGNDLDAMRAAKRTDYGRSDAAFDVDSEIVAEFVEKNLLTNEREITRLVYGDISLAQRIHNWLDRLIAKLPSAKNAQERVFLTRARDMYAKALKDAQQLSDTNLEADVEREGTQFARFSISATLEEDLKKVRNNTFDSASGEVYIGESSDFLTDVIGAERLSVTMPARKAFSAIVTKEEALSDPRYNKNTNYHGLGEEGLVRALVASETPVAAFVSKPGDKGSRFDRIVLVTDEMLNGETLVVVEEVSAFARLNKTQIKANKVITTYDREDVAADIVEAKASGSLLHLDKEKSSQLFAGRPGSNSLVTIQKAELDNNIQNFWANVNWKKAGKTSQTFDDGTETKTAMAYAFENAKEKEPQFSISSEPSEQSDQTAEEKKEKPRSFAAFPKKSQKTILHEENKLLNQISNILSVPYTAKRNSLQGIVRQITDSYLENGLVPPELADELFETAYDEGVVIDDEFYNTYKHVKDYLRKTPVVLRAEYRSDMGNYEEFRKSAWGVLNLSQAATRGIDQVYLDLIDMAPGLFPESITHPANQLQRMYDVATSIRKVEHTLDEVHGPNAKDFKEWARYEFHSKLQDYTAELNLAKRYAEDKQNQPERAVPTTVEEVKALHEQLKHLKREAEKAVNRNLLTDEDNRQVQRLLRGDILPEHLKPERDNVRGIMEVFNAKLECENVASQIEEYKQNVNASRRAAASLVFGNPNDWHDKKTGIAYAKATAERNVEDIAPDRQRAADVKAAYFTPVHKHEAESIEFKKKQRARVDDMNISRKVAKDNKVSESHAVQLVGEIEDHIKALKEQHSKARGRDVSSLQRGGKTLADWEAALENLWIDNPNLDKEKIYKAVEEFRTIYDELFELMNEVRVRNGYEPVSYRRGYFPHFQTGEGEGVLASFGKILGINTEIVALPTTINGLTHMFKPGIKWFGPAMERLGFDTVYDAVQGFDRYIEGVADVIYHTDDIQNLRALASWIRYSASDEGLRQREDVIRVNAELNEAEKKAAIDELYKEGRYKLNKFVVWLDEYTNLLAGKKSRNDRQLEDALNRKMYTVAKNLESRTAANMIAGNLVSALTNFIPLTQAWATVSTRSLLRGMGHTLFATKNSDGISERSTFLVNRRGSDPLVKTWAQKASAAAAKPMELIDSFTSQSIVRARYYDNIKRGLSESAALDEADAWAAGVMADRSKGAMPTLFQQQNPVTKLFTQFQLEVANQFGYLFKDIPRDMRDKGLGAIVAALFKFVLGAWLYNETYEFAIGRRPALDVFGILNDTVGNVFGVEIPNLVELGVGAAKGELPSFRSDKENAEKVAGDLLKNVLEQIPFASILNLAGLDIDAGRIPVSSAVPNLGKIFSSASYAFEAEKEEERAARWKATGKVAGKEFLKPAAYLLPPFGGGQIKKAVEGISAIARGGSYTVDKDNEDILQYPIYRDTTGRTALAALGATIFGKTTLTTGREWVESGFKSFSAKDTALYQAMTELDVGEEKAYNFIKEFKAIEKTDTESKASLQRKFLAKADLSDRAKTVVYYSLLASDSEKDALNPILGDDKKMTDTAKKILKFYEVDPENEKALAMIETGLTAEQYIAVKDEYKRLDEADLTAQGKASKFSSWLNNQNFSAEQKTVIKENFKYYSFVKQEAERYDAFVKAGISDKVASDLDAAIRELKPAAGKTTVSAIQKWNAAVSKITNEKQLQSALETLMTEEQAALFTKTLEASGISSAMYVKGRELLSTYGTNPSNKEIEYAIQDMAENKLQLPGGKKTETLTDEQRAVLWQLWTGSTSTENNPWVRGNTKAYTSAKAIADEAKAKQKAAKEQREKEAKELEESRKGK